MPIDRDSIVDTALARAAQTSWEAVRLHDVAADLGVGLNDVRAHFREKEDIVDAWFDRADRAMLEVAARPEVVVLPARERLERVMLAWFDALAPQRRVTRQMILNKLEPGHVHYQIGGLLRVSRTVQWMREAAGRKAVLPWRALEEAVLTGIYLATFCYWMYDDSPDSIRTRDFLRRRLERAERWARVVPGAPGWARRDGTPQA
ncbi:MAG TPA: TetR/AcrR family transcriptional regulator [Burkholderiales bacterium]